MFTWHEPLFVVSAFEKRKLCAFHQKNVGKDVSSIFGIEVAGERLSVHVLSAKTTKTPQSC